MATKYKELKTLLEKEGFVLHYTHIIPDTPCICGNFDTVWVNLITEQTLLISVSEQGNCSIYEMNLITKDQLLKDIHKKK